MDMQSLELFMDVYQTGNMTTAAQHFYLTQSTVSKRLLALEKEVGARLIERGKGERQVKPTAAGEAFYEIADRMLSLHNSALRLGRDASRMTVSISSMNSAQGYKMPPFIREFQQRHPEVHFVLEDHHSVEIMQLLENKMIDIGVTNRSAPYTDLHSELLYKEPFRVIIFPDTGHPEGSRQPDGPVHPRDLRPELEVYQTFSDALRNWHLEWFPPQHEKLLVDSTTTAIHYLKSPGEWMIAPKCVADAMEKQGFISCPLAEDPPMHHGYVIWREDQKNEMILRCIREMREYFAE